jgi:hypothetical protein
MIIAGERKNTQKVKALCMLACHFLVDIPFFYLKYTQKAITSPRKRKKTGRERAGFFTFLPFLQFLNMPGRYELYIIDE